MDARGAIRYLFAARRGASSQDDESNPVSLKAQREDINSEFEPPETKEAETLEKDENIWNLAGWKRY